MTRRVAFLMDPPERLNPKTDTTLVLLEEALARGFDCYRLEPAAVRFESGQVLAPVFRIDTMEQLEGQAEGDLNLATFDVLWVRQNPPFDLGYITITHFLDLITKTTLVVNHPAALRNHPEKIIVTQFADLIPPTVITGDRSTLLRFHQQQGHVVLKPLYAFGGQDIFLINPDDANTTALIDVMLKTYAPEPIVMQKYLPGVASSGDRRVIMVDGDVIGSFARIPEDGLRSNLVRGGKAEPVSLTPQEQQICARVGPYLKRQGLLFAGLDLIDGHLTEVNVTSPTGIRTLNTLYQMKAEVLIWDAIERRLNPAYVG
ncbi:MAG: glutathione synthase [Holosporales bacterium]